MHGPVDILCLAAVLGRAAYTDLRIHRISNRLSALGLVVGLVLQTIASGLHGLTLGLAGAAVGLVCFVPFYLLRAMGAGDVKLLAAVGAFLGPSGALYAALCSLIVGAIGAIAYVSWCAARASVSTFARDGMAAASAAAFSTARLARRDRLPFALPIAVGGIGVGWYLTSPSGVTALLRGTLN